MNLRINKPLSKEEIEGLEEMGLTEKYLESLIDKAGGIPGLMAPMGHKVKEVYEPQTFGPKVGDLGVVVWVSCGCEWSGKAKVVKVSKMSFLCELLEEVGGPDHYPMGRTIKVMFGRSRDRFIKGGN